MIKWYSHNLSIAGLAFGSILIAILFSLATLVYGDTGWFIDLHLPALVIPSWIMVPGWIGMLLLLGISMYLYLNAEYVSIRDIATNIENEVYLFDLVLILTILWMIGYITEIGILSLGAILLCSVVVLSLIILLLRKNAGAAGFLVMYFFWLVLISWVTLFAVVFS